VRPYYEHAGITIYHGDCRDFFADNDARFDVVLTDPPYGIARVWKGGFKNGWQKCSTQSEERNEWDKEAPPVELWPTILKVATQVIVWGGNYFPLPPSRGWLVWVKPERNFSLSEAELAWTSIDTVIRVYEAVRHIENREHPTEKPVDLMRWCLNKTPGETVVDPFMGSGTTLRAAKDLGRRAIGIEIEEKYCEIAAKRLSQEVFEFSGGEGDSVAP
jgi:site-specific DNA-methyltransferase (adenine-specific)